MLGGKFELVALGVDWAEDVIGLGQMPATTVERIIGAPLGLVDVAERVVGHGLIDPQPGAGQRHQVRGAPRGFRTSPL